MQEYGVVYEQVRSDAIFSPHIGPYHIMKCSACQKYGWVNIYSSVNDHVTWSPQEAGNYLRSVLKTQDTKNPKHP